MLVNLTTTKQYPPINRCRNLPSCNLRSPLYWEKMYPWKGEGTRSKLNLYELTSKPHRRQRNARLNRFQMRVCTLVVNAKPSVVDRTIIFPSSHVALSLSLSLSIHARDWGLNSLPKLINHSGFLHQTDLSFRKRYIHSPVCPGFHFAKMSFNPLHEGQAAQQHDSLEVIREIFWIKEIRSPLHIN